MLQERPFPCLKTVLWVSVLRGKALIPWLHAIASIAYQIGSLVATPMTTSEENVKHFTGYLKNGRYDRK